MFWFRVRSRFASLASLLPGFHVVLGDVASLRNNPFTTASAFRDSDAGSARQPPFRGRRQARTGGRSSFARRAAWSVFKGECSSPSRRRPLPALAGHPSRLAPSVQLRTGTDQGNPTV